MAIQHPALTVPEEATARLDRSAGRLAETIRASRQARRWSVRDVAEAAGISRSALAKIEGGRLAGLLTYQRIADALDLDLALDLHAPVVVRDDEDAVHSAMGEVLARRHDRPDTVVLVDEPYQHFQFAGRADQVVVDRGRLALAHHEFKTRIVNVGETAGSYNAKCVWLADEIGKRLGIRRFHSVCHTLVLLWSTEMIEVVRSRVATLRALGPDGTRPFEAWWAGDPPPGTHRGMVLFDPVDGGPGQRRWVDLDGALEARPRYRGYADALEALRAVGLA